MTDLAKQLPCTQLTALADTEAIRHLEQAIAAGEHWYVALLEAIKLWDSAEETYNGRPYRYLIAGEAFDWLLLAERLCQAVDGLLPGEEKTRLLFHGVPPLNLPSRRFRELIGTVKYRQHLNYFYGVTVEEALIIAVQEEVRKERWTAGDSREKDTTGEAFRRIYGVSKGILLRQFRREKHYPQLQSIYLAELKEFTYWLFKYRFKQCDRSRVASDTSKALTWLNQNGFTRRLHKQEVTPECIEILPAIPQDFQTKPTGR